MSGVGDPTSYFSYTLLDFIKYCSPSWDVPRDVIKSRVFLVFNARALPKYNITRHNGINRM